MNKNKQDMCNEGLNLLKETLEIAENYNSSSHTDIVAILNNIGLAFQNDKQDYDQALAMLQKDYPSYYGHIAETIAIKGHLLSAQDKYQEALDILEEALKILDNYYHMETIIHLRILNEIGNVLCKMKKYDEALKVYQKLLRIKEKYYESDDVTIGDTLFGIGIRQLYFPLIYKPIVASFYELGEILKHQGEFDDAVECYQEALDVYRIYNPTDYITIANKLKHIADISAEQGNYEQSINYYEQYVNIFENYYPNKCLEIAEAFNNMARSYVQQQDSESALTYFTKCLEIQEINLTIEYRRTIVTLVTLTLLGQLIDRYDLSLSYAFKNLLVFEKIYPPDAYEISRTTLIIGQCYEHFNDLPLALEYHKRALTIYEQVLLESHQKREEVEVNIERLEQALNAQQNIQA